MSYKRIRSLARGISVLQHLSAVKAATAAEIAKNAGLPRPTVYRILETLVEEGLIYQSRSSSSVYRLTADVRDLSAGFIDASSPGHDSDKDEPALTDCSSRDSSYLS